MRTINDVQMVHKVINDYIDASYRADIKKMKEDVFYENATMNGYLDGKTVFTPIQGFYDMLNPEKSMEKLKTPYKAEIISIDVLGNMATANIYENNYDNIFNFEDRFQLIKHNNKWRIINKLFTTIPF